MKPKLLKSSIIPKLSLICATTGLLAGAASAQISVYIDNPGFELPNTTKITAGWDVSTNDVPGWMDAGLGNSNSGIESPGQHYYSGNWGGFAMGGDPGAYQLSTNVMSYGQEYTLTWYGSDSWQGVAKTSLIRADNTNTPAASCTEVATFTVDFTDSSWAQYTLVYVAGASDVGKYIGIRFSDIGPAGNSWCNWDDFSLSFVQGDGLPHITAQPVGQTVYEGGFATITAAAAGPDITGYQWKAGAVGSGVYTNIPGATTTTLTIPYAKASADYVLIVSNAGGTATSDPATLTVTPATYVNGLFNGDFALPGTGKINSGFDVPNNDVPGWRNAGPNQNDTGIESAGSGRTDSYAAYLHRGQSGAFQIGTNLITQVGDIVTLTWWARDSWQGVNAKVSLLSATAQDAAFGSATVLAAKTNEVTGWWGQNTITYTAGAGDVGKLIGVAFQSADPATVNGWANFDDFGITVIPPTAAPQILGQPASTTAYLGAATTFTVLASGSGLNYQWQAGVVGSGVYTNISNGGQFSGATTASLTVSNIATANGLDYVVVISNTGGSVTSTPATLTVDPNIPTVITQPASLTRLTTETATFTVAANGAVTYQWKAGAVGSGVYTNLSNGGQFSGVNTATLTITNLQFNNQADYVVEVSNGAGSVTSDAANLTIHLGIYVQTFETTSNDITAVGWVADHSSSQGTLADPYWGGKGIWSAGDTGVPQAFYTTTILEKGTIPGQMAFPVIKLAAVSNLTFYVDEQSWWNPGSVHTHFAVQLNWGAWYVASSDLATATGGQETRTMVLDTNAVAWNQLTVTGTGGTNNASLTVIGGQATNDLTGYITGAGVVALHDSSSWIIMDNFKISGDGFTVLPGLGIANTGANVVLTWGYGTLVESTSVTGPWTPVSGTSPKTVSPTGGTHFYRLQLP